MSSAPEICSVKFHWSSKLNVLRQLESKINVHLAPWMKRVSMSFAENSRTLQSKWSFRHSNTRTHGRPSRLNSSLRLITSKGSLIIWRKSFIINSLVWILKMEQRFSGKVKSASLSRSWYQDVLSSTLRNQITLWFFWRLWPQEAMLAPTQYSTNHPTATQSKQREAWLCWFWSKFSFSILRTNTKKLGQLWTAHWISSRSFRSRCATLG